MFLQLQNLLTSFALRYASLLASKKLRMDFLEARRYLSSRWDVPVGDSWLTAFASSATAATAEPFWKAPPWEALDSEEPNKGRAKALAGWFAEGLDVVSLGAVRSWDLQFASRDEEICEVCEEPILKIPGSLLYVPENGWGAVPEIFRAYRAWRARLNPKSPKPKSRSKKSKTPERPQRLGSQGSLCSPSSDPGPLEPLVTLRFSKCLLQDEILAFPHSFKEDHGQTWHLVALVCSSTRTEKPACIPAKDAKAMKAPKAPSRCRAVTFLHGGGGKEWLVDGNAQMHEIRRWPLGSVPNAWLCTRDLTPQLAVYSTLAPRGHVKLPHLTRLPAIAGWRSDLTATLTVRVVTEKSLQMTRGSFAGGAEVPASAELTLPMAASLEDLKQQIHQQMRIPAERVPGDPVGSLRYRNLSE